MNISKGSRVITELAKTISQFFIATNDSQKPPIVIRNTTDVNFIPYLKSKNGGLIFFLKKSKNKSKHTELKNILYMVTINVLE